MNARKGLSSTMKIGGMLVIALLLVAGMVGGAALFMQGSIADDGQDPASEDDGEDTDTAPWAQRSVKLDIEGKNLSSETIKSGTLHFYEEKPDEWENPRTISETYGTSEEYTSYSIESDGRTTIQEEPGTYYVVAEVSGDYPAFFTVEVPDGSNFPDTSLSDYNQEPILERFTSADRYSLGSSSFDLGISSNSSTTQDYEAHNTYRLDDNTEYRLWKTVIQPGSNSGGVDPTTDSDSDGTYDEGVSKAFVEVTGGVDQASAETNTFFHPGNGIDKLGAPDKAELNMEGLVFDDANSMTVAVGSTVVESEDGSNAADGDEKASDGERLWDINYCDVAGNCNSVAGVTG